MHNGKIIGEEPKLISVTTKKVEIYNTVKPLSINHALIKILAPANSFVYWQSAELVDFGYFDGDKINLNDHEPHFDLLQEMRVFNETFELHIWKHLGESRYRIRQETDEQENENGNCLLHKVKLWGTKATKNGRFTVVTEDRGMRLSFPIEFQDAYKDRINVFLEERRYIEEEDETGCIHFSDRRFSGLYVATGGQLKKVEVNTHD